MPRQYTDISHFRAPFKNWPGIGADALDPVAAMIDTEPNGVRVFKPAIADIILKMLSGFSVIFLDNTSVKLDAKTPGDPREGADVWVARQLKDGNTVVAQGVGGAHLFGMPIVMDRFLRAGSGEAFEKEATAGVTPVGAVLARGGKLGLFGLGPVGTAGVFLVAAGALFWGAKRLSKKRRAVANRRKSKRMSAADKRYADWYLSRHQRRGTKRRSR